MNATMPFTGARRNFLFLFCAVLLAAAAWLFAVFDGMPGHKRVRDIVARELIRETPLRKQDTRKKTALYVLGGSQQSLQEKFKVASALFQRAPLIKVHFLKEEGVTEFDPLLGRNLTNVEWAIRSMTALGIAPGTIEPVALSGKKAFGTLSEALGVSRLSAERGYERVILVASAHHTMRTWLTFSALMGKEKGVACYLYASPDQAELRQLLLEYCKLLFYKNVLLRFYRG